MRNLGTLHLKLVALGVAAALGSSTLLAQQSDPSPIERDRASVSENDSLDADSQLDRDSDRQAQSRDSEISPSQQRAGQSPEPGSQRQAGQQQGQAGQQQPGQQPGQQSSQAQDRELQASQQSGSSDGAEAFEAITDQQDNLGTFVEAIKAAGLEDSLTDGTEYTVFAPTDEAFEQALESMGKTKEELLGADGREDLIALLRAHIVADDVDQEMARNLSEARTIDGGSVSLSSEGEELMVGDATVVETDIQEGNLRVYSIDQVLEANAPAQAADASQSQELEGEQPAASVRTPRGEQPSANALDSDSELSARQRAEDDDEPEPRLN